MNERERFTMQEQKQEILSRDNFMCQYPCCMNRAVIMAHRIGKGVYNRAWVKKKLWSQLQIDATEKQIDLVIHHKFNMVSVCSRTDHNDAFNRAFKRMDADALFLEIVNDLKEKGKL